VTIIKCHHCMTLFVQIHSHNLIRIRVCTSNIIASVFFLFFLPSPPPPSRHFRKIINHVQTEVHLLWFHFALTSVCWKVTTVNVHCVFKNQNHL
jgi:hypothetical protein